MQRLTDVIEMIGENPGLYLCARTIECFGSVVDGWVLGADYPEDDNELLMTRFQNWIAQRFDVHSTQSWDSIIRCYSKDSLGALGQYFPLFADFKIADGATPNG